MVRGRLFPVGVYATLLGALCWLAVPGFTGGVERLLVGVMCLPLRAYASVWGEPGRVASADPGEWQLVRALLEGQHQAATEIGARDEMEPLVCRVLQWGDPGGAGLPAELILDRTYRELRGCEPWVTYGDRLLGFLARPGEGAARDDDRDDRARVLLLNHADASPVPAYLPMDGDQVLRCVVEAAGSVDRWPLRCALWEDPYVAFTLVESGGELRTIELDGGGVPGGLLLGSSRVWGYELEGKTLPIGLYVQPAMDPRAISTVVLWRRPSAETVGLRPPSPSRVEPVSLLEVPGPAGPRLFANGRWSATLPTGAALVQGLRLLGTLRGLGPGQALVDLFEDSTRDWSLILLPEFGAPVDLRGRVVEREGGRVWIQLLDGSRGQVGHLFTGVNGLHCPAGLLVGEVRDVGDGGGRVLVERPARIPGGSGHGVFLFAEEER